MVKVLSVTLGTALPSAYFRLTLFRPHMESGEATMVTVLPAAALVTVLPFTVKLILPFLTVPVLSL